jgi:DNA-binding NarL/FixJ family response regulator
LANINYFAIYPPFNITEGKSLIITNIICTNADFEKLKQTQIPISFVPETISTLLIKNILNLREQRINQLSISNSSIQYKLDNHKNSLTPREIEIFNLIEKGLTSLAISEHLFISKRTVDNHRQNIKTKLKLNPGIV